MKFEIIMAIVIWVVAIIGIIVMKKLQSGGKLYPAWAIFVATSVGETIAARAMTEVTRPGVKFI